MSKFYKDNKIPIALSQAAPEYAKNPDKAPESDSFSSAYGGQKSQSQGILAILAMLAEDLEKEIADGRSDDARHYRRDIANSETPEQLKELLAKAVVEGHGWRRPQAQAQSLAMRLAPRTMFYSPRAIW